MFMLDMKHQVFLGFLLRV